MDLKENIDFKGHSFVPISLEMKMKYGLISSDKICNHCGIVVNHTYFIIYTDWRNSVRIDKYELNCNEVMIKRLLE